MGLSGGWHDEVLLEPRGVSGGWRRRGDRPEEALATAGSVGPLPRQDPPAYPYRRFFFFRGGGGGGFAAFTSSGDGTSGGGISRWTTNCWPTVQTLVVIQ